MQFSVLSAHRRDALPCSKVTAVSANTQTHRHIISPGLLLDAQGASLFTLRAILITLIKEEH